MGQAAFNIRYAGQEDGILLMVVVRLEHELVPVGWRQPEFEQVVESGAVVGAVTMEHGAFQEGHPVGRGCVNQDQK